MRILHVLPHWTYGGVEMFVSTLAKYSSHTHFFIAHKYSRVPPEVPDELHRYSKLPHCLPSPIDVWHYHHTGICSRPMVPSVFTVHNIYNSEVRREEHTRTIAVSEPARRATEAHGVFVGAVVPPPIDFSVFNPEPDEALLRKMDVVRRRYGIGNSGKPVVLWAGRICPGKRPEIVAGLIDTYSNDYEFVIVGSDYIAGSNRNVPPFVFRALKSAQWVSHASHEDMAVLYHIADVVISTSAKEGFGLTIAEAMACGTPVVVPNVSALRELVGCGSYGVCVDGDAIEAFAGGIARAITGVAGRDYDTGAVERVWSLGCDAECVARIYDAIYEEAVL